MLNHTKKIKGIYEDIQRKLFYMIPEKWEKLYLYSSVIDMPKNVQNGELYFYYIPKGIFKKNPVNVYEIPTKFNLEEREYLKLVEILYDNIKQLREEFKKSESEKIWSNITISIQNIKFKVEYGYEDLKDTDFNSYERHVIWRYQYLGIGPEQVSKADKEILRRYLNGPKTMQRKETYESGIYIQDIKNIVDYSTQSYETTQSVQDIETKDKKINKNQILFSEEEMRITKMQNDIK